MKMNKWEKEIEQIYQNELRKTGTELAKAYADILKRLKKEGRDVLSDPTNLTRTQKYNAQRKVALEKRILKMLREVHPEIRKEIKRLAKKSGELGYYGTQYNIEQIAQTVILMPRISPRYLNTVVTDKIDGSRFSERLYRDTNKMARTVSRELIRAAEDGIGYGELARRLEAVTTNNFKHSFLIARTESKRTRSTMHQRAYEEAINAGVKLEKEWMYGNVSKHPRSWHQDMDGMRVPAEEMFITPRGNAGKGPGLFGVAYEDINCGCYTVTHVTGIEQTGQKFKPRDNWHEWAKEKDVGVDGV